MMGTIYIHVEEEDGTIYGIIIFRNGTKKGTQKS